MSKMYYSSCGIVAQGHEDSAVSVLEKEQRRHKQCTTGSGGSKLYRDSILLYHSKTVIRKFDKIEKYLIYKI
jgi:hypothetical protein